MVQLHTENILLLTNILDDMYLSQELTTHFKVCAFCWWPSFLFWNFHFENLFMLSLKNLFQVTQVQWQCQGTQSRAHKVPYHWWDTLCKLPYAFPVTKRVWSRESLRPPVLARGSECRMREKEFIFSLSATLTFSPCNGAIFIMIRKIQNWLKST